MRANRITASSNRIVSYIIMCFMIVGCGGGSRIVKEPQVIETTQPLASGIDRNIAVDLYWVIIRNGPGSWAKNADWDEYIIHFHNISGEPLTITNVALYDYLGNRVETQLDLNKLIKGSKKAEERYQIANVRVEAGMGTKNMLITGGAATAAGVGAIAAAVTHPFAAGAGAAALAGVGLVLVGPVILVSGVNKSINNNKLNEEIKKRATVLPHVLSGSGSVNMDLFYPLSPSPKSIQVEYQIKGVEHELKIDTSEALEGLHIYREGVHAP